MILGRRDPPGLLPRLRGWLWPRTGWRRAGRYLVARVQRTPGTPHSIAAGVATGVAVSLTPFVGLHLLLALGLAYLAGGDLLAAAVGTLVGNPWTWPLILPATYRLGCLILGQPPHGLRDLARLDPGGLLGEAGLLLWPMVVGSVPLAAAAWVATYFPLARAMAVVQEKRRLRRERRPCATTRPAAAAHPRRRRGPRPARRACGGRPRRR